MILAFSTGFMLFAGLILCIAFVAMLIVLLFGDEFSKPGKVNWGDVTRAQLQNCRVSLGGGWYIYDVVLYMHNGESLLGTIESRAKEEIEKETCVMKIMQRIRYDTFTPSTDLIIPPLH